MKINDSLMYQKSRSKWVLQGDSNAKLYHDVINWKRRKNGIKGISLEGGWAEDPTIVKKKSLRLF